LEVVDIRQQTVVDEFCLDTNPFDIAVLPKHLAAISLPMAKSILIANTSRKMKTKAHIRMLVSCFGVTSHQQLLYVVCKRHHKNEYYITVLNTECEERIQIIALPSSVICPRYIALSNDQQKLFVSDQGTDSVVAFSVNETAISEYKNNSLKTPTGLVVLENGSILVCSKRMGAILLVTADFRLGRIVANNVSGVQSICYQPNGLQVFVGSIDFDKVQVFSLEMGAGTNSQNQTDLQMQQSAESGLHKILL
jgi:6-phosphogluconolactonase (cycloisomerase 2 family)